MFTLLDPRMTQEHLGLLPYIFRSSDPRPAREQANDRYSHGGGWSPLSGWTIDEAFRITYPGDSPLLPLARAQLRDETIILYRHSWVAIIQANGSFEVSRMD